MLIRFIPSWRAIGWRAMFVAAALAACSDAPTAPPSQSSEVVPANELRTIKAPLLANTRESSPLMSIESCAPVVRYRLTNLRHTPGEVIVTNDASKLYVTYQIGRRGGDDDDDDDDEDDDDRRTSTDNWYISDTRLAVGKKYSDIPQDRRGIPLPWSFPHSGVHQPPVKSVTYAIPLVELGVGAGDNLVIAAMAGVVHPKTSRLDGPWEWLVVWGLGNVDGRSMETLHNYRVAPCGDAPPPPPSTGGGIFTLTFDDGWKNHYDVVYPILKNLGIKGNIAVNPDPIDLHWNGYMTLAQLRTLHRAGWSIVSHSLSHRDLTHLSDSELHRELRDSKAWLKRHGFGPTDVFVVPFHSWGERERNAIAQYYKRARGYTVNQFVPDYFAKYPLVKPLDLSGYESEFAPFTTAEGRAKTVAYVKRAVTQGEFIDLFFHQITPSQVEGFKLLLKDLMPYKRNLRTWGQF